MIAYKFLRAGRVGPFSGVRWPEPGGDGAWVTALDSATRVHGCGIGELVEWCDAELWRVELDGDVSASCGMLAADRGRLLERIATWDTEAAINLAEACAQRCREAAATLAGQADPRAVRAVEMAADAAKKAPQARLRADLAPLSGASAAFIARHAAANATGDDGAVQTELAWQADWLAARLGLS